MHNTQDIFELANEERERLITEFKSIPEDIINAEEARRSAKFKEEQDKREAHKMEELEKFYEANKKQISKDVAWTLSSIKRTNDTSAWIPYGEGEPVVGIDLESFEQVVLYYSFEDLDTYKVL